MLPREAQRTGLAAAQADVRAAHFEFDQIADRDAAHQAHERARDEPELHQAAAEGTLAADGAEAGALAGMELVQA